MLRISRSKLYMTACILMLFLIGMNFGGSGSELVLVLSALVLLRGKFSWVIKVDWLGIFVCLFFLFYAYFMNLYGGTYMVYFTHFAVPCLLYYIGKSIKLPESADQRMLVILAPVLGLAVWGILNSYQTTRTAAEVLHRQSVDFWSDIPMASSRQASFFYLLAAFTGFKIWVNKIKLVDLVSIIFVAVGVLTTGTRGLLFLFAGMSVVGYLYLMKTKSIKGGRKNKKLTAVVVIALAVLLAYAVDLFGIATKISSSTFYLRLTGQMDTDNIDGMLNNNGRFERYALFFSQVPTHLMGNMTLGEYGSAHNTFFDVYRVGGIIPFVLFMIVVGILIRRLVRSLKQRQPKDRVMLCLCAGITGMFLPFMTESLFALNINVMCAYIFLAGLLSQMYMQNRTIRQAE